MHSPEMWISIYKIFCKNPQKNSIKILKYLPPELLNEIIDDSVNNNIFNILQKENLIHDLIINYVIWEKNKYPTVIKNVINKGYDLFEYLDFINHIPELNYYGIFEGECNSIHYGYHHSEMHIIIKFISIEVTKNFRKKKHIYANMVYDYIQNEYKEINIFPSDISISHLILDYYADICINCNHFHIGYLRPKYRCLNERWYANTDLNKIEK